jgi:acetyl esterase/lipase
VSVALRGLLKYTIALAVFLMIAACLGSAAIPQTETVYQPTVYFTPTTQPPALLPTPTEYETPDETDTPEVIPTATVTPFPSPDPSFDIGKAGTEEKNVVYCNAAGVQLKMDIYYPYAVTRSWPVALLIHGGSWMSGSKSNDLTLRFVEPLRQAEYLVAAVNYRLAPQFKFPDQIEDVKCAIRYLRANTQDYNLDPNRFAALGFSAGGHLAALAGLTDSGQFNHVGGHEGYSGKVQAVVDISGPTKMSLFCNPDTIKAVFGAADCDDYNKLHPADPAGYADPRDPPVMIIHGDQDTAVPLGSSTYLKEKLDQANIFNVLLVVKGAGHSYDSSVQPIEPDFSQITEFVLQFLEVALK